MIAPQIILDSRRTEKYDLLMYELSRQGIIDYQIWPCLLEKTVVSSINLSHKMIIRHAKENKWEQVCVFEDDIMFPAADGFEYFISGIPDKFELYLGATYILPITNRKIVGFHCYILHESAYDKFLSVPDDVHIDVAMEDILDWTVCYPFAALQRKGFSANNMKVTDYNWVLSDCDVYGGLP